MKIKAPAKIVSLKRPAFEKKVSELTEGAYTPKALTACFEFEYYENGYKIILKVNEKI